MFDRDYCFYVYTFLLAISSYFFFLCWHQTVVACVTVFKPVVAESGFIEGVELDDFFRDLVGVLDKKDVHVTSYLRCAAI